MNIFLQIKTLLFLLILSLPFIGAECTTNDPNVQPGDIYGRWALIYNAGDKKDVCPGEQINLTQNNIAYLRCPARDSISAAYSLNGNILTYTETNIQYEIRNVSTINMELSGINVSRYLYYTRNIPATIPPQNDKNKNSFEK